MKQIFKCLIFLTFGLVANAQDKKNFLLEFLTEGKQVAAEFVDVIEDPSIKEYAAKFRNAQAEDPEWFAEHLKKGKPGCPIDFDEKIMSKKQYDGYLKAWKKRKLVPRKGNDGKNIKIDVILTKEENGNYIINVKNVPISSLEYSADTNSFSSVAGELTYLDKIEAPKESSIGAWSGYEWKGGQVSTFSEVKQHIAIGRTADNKYGILIFSNIQFSGKTLLAQNNYLIRFAPVKK